MMVDPPWHERGGGKIKRGADRHFDLVKTKDMPAVITAFPEWRLLDNAHLYMWTTNTQLANGGALWLVKELGFRSITIITWPKHRMGIGQYFRGKTEHMIFAANGKGKHESVFQDNRTLHTLLENADHSRIHSRKPEAAFDLVEARSKGPYLEVFGAPSLPLRPGWKRCGKPRYSEVESAGV